MSYTLLHLINNIAYMQLLFIDLKSIPVGCHLCSCYAFQYDRPSVPTPRNNIMTTVYLCVNDIGTE